MAHHLSLQVTHQVQVFGLTNWLVLYLNMRPTAYIFKTERYEFGGKKVKKMHIQKKKETKKIYIASKKKSRLHLMRQIK